MRALKEEVLGKKAGFEAGGILFLLFSWSKGMSFVQKDPQLGFLGLSGRLFDDDVFFPTGHPFLAKFKGKPKGTPHLVGSLIFRQPRLHLSSS